MIIGNLNKDLKGKISTLEATFILKLIPNEEMKKENSPTHSIMAQSFSGDTIQIGSAWERTINEGKSRGLKMFSLAMEDPSFKAPLNCSAFPSTDGYYITFERQQKQSKEDF